MEIIEGKKRLTILFSPYIFLIFVWIFFFLSIIPNSLGWGNQYKVPVSNYLNFYIIFSISFLVGCFFVKNIKPRKSTLTPIITRNISLRLFVLFLISVFFTLVKFYNIRDIPLFGDPFSRYEFSLGGFIDFPTRLLTPAGLIGFLFYKQTNKKKYLLIYIIALVLHVLYMWRQEILNLLIGAFMIYSIDKEFRFFRLLKISITVVLLIFAVVGLGGFLRFNDQLNTTVFDLGLSMLHGELSTANKFGAYVVDKLDNDFLYGRYNYGSFITIFNPSFKETGAEYLRIRYTNAETAQSIGVPFSYHIDFGYWGITLFGLINGYLATHFFKRFNASKNGFYTATYVLIFLQLLFSIRSGNFLIGIFFLYLVAGIAFVFFKHSRLKKYVGFYDFIFIKIILISFIFLLIRF